MAGGGIVTSGKQYPGKLTWNVFVTCIIAAAGGLIFGYDLGISGGVTSMDSFLEKFFPSVHRKQSSTKPSDNQYCKFDSQTLTLFTSSLYLAALLSCLCASTITRRLGRRITMILGGVLFLLGAIVNASAVNVAMLIAGRILLGFGIGCANQSVPIYVSEMAPCKYRGALNMMFQMAITIGILVANLVNYFFAKIEGGWGWRLSLGGAGVPALIIIAGGIFLPETPNSLIERGKTEEAREQLKTIRGIPDVDQEFDDLVVASEASQRVNHPWKSLLSRKYRPQLSFSIIIPALQQLTGVNVVIFYAPVLFKTVGFGDDASLMSAVITGLVNCCATLVSIFTVDKVGRRKLFLEGGIQMFIFQFVIGTTIALKFGTSGNPGTLEKWYAGLLVFFICVYISGFAWSWGPLGWLVPSEIFPLEVRSAAQSVNVSVNMIFTFVIAQIFTALLCRIKFGLFFSFAFFLVVMSVVIYFFLPETKGIPIEEMHTVWQKHWYWKRFVPQDQDTKRIEII